MGVQAKQNKTPCKPNQSVGMPGTEMVNARLICCIAIVRSYGSQAADGKSQCRRERQGRQPGQHDLAQRDPIQRLRAHPDPGDGPD